MKLTINDIAFIAEQRTLNVSWDILSYIYGSSVVYLMYNFNYRMRVGYAA
jgi:anaerobic ribonucleoside-triphosphate reductase